MFGVDRCYRLIMIRTTRCSRRAEKLLELFYVRVTPAVHSPEHPSSDGTTGQSTSGTGKASRVPVGALPVRMPVGNCPDLAARHSATGHQRSLDPGRHSRHRCHRPQCRQDFESDGGTGGTGSPRSANAREHRPADTATVGIQLDCSPEDRSGYGRLAAESQAMAAGHPCWPLP